MGYTCSLQTLRGGILIYTGRHCFGICFQKVLNERDKKAGALQINQNISGCYKQKCFKNILFLEGIL